MRRRLRGFSRPSMQGRISRALILEDTSRHEFNYSCPLFMQLFNLESTILKPKQSRPQPLPMLCQELLLLLLLVLQLPSPLFLVPPRMQARSATTLATLVKQHAASGSLSRNTKSLPNALLRSPMYPHQATGRISACQI